MNDEKIGAFIDRESDEAARAELAKALDASAGGTMRLRIFKKADELLRRAVPASASASDHALSQRILSAESIRMPGSLHLLRRAAPLAAACLLGVVLGSISVDRSPRFSLTQLNGDIGGALEAVRSGESREVAGGRVTLALTVQTESGAFCRQFRLSTTQETTDALACRDQANWNVVVAAAAPHANNNAYHLAGSVQGAVDAALIALGGGSVVDEAQEDALLRNHWRAAEIDARPRE
ncbi:hypothetical protein U91I_01504 [alpha proteobacterium U9-1i]|nr:hypothetical protein U91I_01504 [alpha proteobacterium U9-1i]